MGLYAGQLIFGRIFASEIWGGLLSGGLILGGGLLSEFYGMLSVLEIMYFVPVVYCVVFEFPVGKMCHTLFLNHLQS